MVKRDKAGHRYDDRLGCYLCDICGNPGAIACKGGLYRCSGCFKPGKEKEEPMIRFPTTFFEKPPQCWECGSFENLRNLKNGEVLCESCILKKVEERDKALDESEGGETE